MYLARRGVQRRKIVDDRLYNLLVVVIDIGIFEIQIEEIAINIDFALAGLGQNDEFMAEITADRAGVGAHRDRLQPHPREGAQIGDEHLIVGVFGARRVEIEAVIVLHQELAAAHHAKARPHLVAEFPLDVVEVLRQVAIALDRGADDLGDLLLVGRPVQHLAVVPVADAQHLLAVIVVAPALAPQLGRLHGRHQDLQSSGTVLLLAHDALDLLEHAQSQRQPGINAGARLADHPGAQHQPVRDDLRLARVLAQQRQEVLGKAHGSSLAQRPQSSTGAVAKTLPGAKKRVTACGILRTIAS